MIQAFCSHCSSPFQAGLDAAGKLVKCPRCSEQVRIPELFDAPKAEAAGSRGDRQRVEIFSSAARPAVPKPAPPSPLRRLALPAGAVVLLGVGGLVAWHLLAGEPEAPRRPLAHPDAPVAPVAPPPEAKPVAPAPVAAVIPLPDMPAAVGLDLLGERQIAAALPSGLAWSGDSLVASASGAAWTCRWYLAPDAATAVVLDADLAIHPAVVGGPVTTALSLVLPLGPSGSVRAALDWPIDGRVHRLRCWARPDAVPVVARDDAVLATGVVIARDPAALAMEISGASGPAKLAAVRLLAAGAWRALPAPDAPPAERTWSGAALPPPAPVPAVHARPFACDAIDPGVAAAFWAADPVRRAALAEDCADLVRDLVRPRTQAEFDLAARLLWLGAQIQPGHPRVVAVAAALADADPAAALAQLPPGHPRPPGDAIERVLAASAPPELALPMAGLLAYLEPWAARPLPSGLAPEHALDWPWLIAAVGGRSGSEAALRGELRLDQPQLLRHGGYLRAADRAAACAIADEAVPAVELDATGRPVPADWLGLRARRYQRGPGWAEGDAIAVPGEVLRGDATATIACTGAGTVRIAPLGAAEEVVAEFAIDAPDRYVPDGQPALSEPVAVIHGWLHGVPKLVWRPWRRQPGHAGPEQRPGIDQQRILAPEQIDLHRNGADLDWRFQGKAGHAACARPLQILIIPAPGPGLRVLRTAVVAAPPAASPVALDALHWEHAAPLRPAPAPPAPRPPGTGERLVLLGLSQHAFTVGAKAAFTLFMNRAPTADEAILAWDVGDHAGWPTTNWLREDPAPRPVRFDPLLSRPLPTAAAPQEHEARGLLPHRGFALRIIGQATDPAPPGAYACAVACDAGQLGDYLLFPLSRTRGERLEAIVAEPAPRLLVLPFRPGWDPAAWCRGLTDRDRDGFIDGRDHGLAEAVLAMSGELQYDDPVNPKRRPAAGPALPGAPPHAP